MKIKNLIKVFAIAVMAAFTACDDDDVKPIYLYDVQNNQRITEGQEMTVYCFREHKFVVRGGSGRYDVINTEGGNIEYRWSEDKDTLIIMANLPIDASITLADKAAGNVTIRINAEYQNNRYKVQSIESKVKGGKMIVDDQKRLETKIVNEAYIKEGYTFIFIYDNENNPNAGQLRITDSSSQKVGTTKTFIEDKAYISSEEDRDTSLQKIRVYENNVLRTTYTLVLKKTENNHKEVVKIQEDVKDKYKSQFANLEEAFAVYNVSSIAQ